MRRPICPLILILGLLILACPLPIMAQVPNEGIANIIIQARQKNSAQLKETIVGKTVTVRNMVTGHRFEILYGANGQRLVTAMDGKALDPAVRGDLMFDPETEYKIRDGHISTYIGGTPFEVIIDKLGNKYNIWRPAAMNMATPITRSKW